MHLLAQSLIADFGPHIVAGIVAALGAYSANRFFLGGLSKEVQQHGKRLDVLEFDVKSQAVDIAWIKGKTDL